MPFKRDDVSGKRYGKLTAIDFCEIRSGRTYWNFACDCGNIICRCINETKRKLKNKLLGGLCCEKCYKVPSGKNSHAWQGCGDVPKSVLTSIAHSAKDKGLECNLTLEFLAGLYEYQNKSCAYTHWPLKFSSKYGMADGTASLDRINAKLGYTKENVQWVHVHINYFKRSMSHDDFLLFCNAVSNVWHLDINQTSCSFHEGVIIAPRHHIKQNKKEGV